MMPHVTVIIHHANKSAQLSFSLRCFGSLHSLNFIVDRLNAFSGDAVAQVFHLGFAKKGLLEVW